MHFVLVSQRYVLSSLMTNSFLHSVFLLSSKQSLLPPTCQVSQHLACTGSGLDGTSAERSSRRTEKHLSHIHILNGAHMTKLIMLE